MNGRPHDIGSLLAFLLPWALVRFLGWEGCYEGVCAVAFQGRFDSISAAFKRCLFPLYFIRTQVGSRDDIGKEEVEEVK